MIAIKLSRDEARAMQQYFFCYLDEVCSMKERQATELQEKMLQHIIKDIFNQVRKLFVKKLCNKSNTITFNFEDSQAIVLFQLLFNFPIEEKDYYLSQLRQLFCNVMYDQITKVLSLEEIKQMQADAMTA